MVNICGKYVKITGSDFGTTPLTESEAAPGREFVDLRGLEKPPEDLLLRRPRTVIMSVDGDLEQNWFFLIFVGKMMGLLMKIYENDSRSP